MNNQSRHARLHERYRKIFLDRATHPDQPLRTFCRSHKISVWTYYYWKKKIPVDQVTIDPKTATQSFLPIALTPEESPSIFYEIHFGNRTRLSVQSGFNRDEAATLINLLCAMVS